MRLVSVYIKDHEFWFENPQAINLGGKYRYSFMEQGENLLVKRKKQENHLDGFFSIADSKVHITSLSAIVGANGAGKSTLLNALRLPSIDNVNALPKIQVLYVFETPSEDLPLIINFGFNDVFLEKRTGDSLVPLGRSASDEIQTLYYSPHLDLKYNPDFDQYDLFDFSTDVFIQQDLSELEDKEVRGSSWPITPHEELIFHNTIRQVDFLASDIVKHNELFLHLFQLPSTKQYELIINGYKREEPWHNTPYAFRSPLDIIIRKIAEERKEWSKITPQLDINKWLLKNEILSSLVNLLIRQMEKHNTFLMEGKVKIKDFENKTIDKTAYQALLFFLEKSYLLRQKKKSVLAFNHQSIKSLIDRLFEGIELMNSKDEVSKDSFYAGYEYFKDILHLQRQTIINISTYYNRFEDYNSFQNSDAISGFVKGRLRAPLSSGENALLNLFSRLYYQTRKMDPKAPFLLPKSHFVFLLDEGDMGFHPIWKKKYVHTLLSTLPHFFEELKAMVKEVGENGRLRKVNKTPTLQIIFTTHDPLSLSDLPNNHVVYMERILGKNKGRVLQDDELQRPKATFGANVTELLADSFFMEGGLLGDFVQRKINDTITWLNSEVVIDAEKYESIIRILDEPVIQRKLAEMYDQKMHEKLESKVIDDQITKLQALKKKLKNPNDTSEPK